MSTGIPYLDETWNPIVGCSHCSPGCDNCWAEKTAKQLASMALEGYCHATTREGKWSGRTYLNARTLNKPLHWKKPRNIGVCFMGDLFHELVPFEWIEKVFSIFGRAEQHNYLILTKRPKQMKEFIFQCDNNFTVPGWFKRSYPNVFLGVSVCNQEEAWKIDVLRDIPAAHRWVSFEPLLERVHPGSLKGIDWCVIGAESGPNKRLLSINDVFQLVSECQLSDKDIYVKQIHGYKDELRGKLITDITKFPKDLQIQEFPSELRRK